MAETHALRDKTDGGGLSDIFPPEAENQGAWRLMFVFVQGCSKDGAT